jgi:hypothetical protein
MHDSTSLASIRAGSGEMLAMYHHDLCSPWRADGGLSSLGQLFLGQGHLAKARRLRVWRHMIFGAEAQDGCSCCCSRMCELVVHAVADLSYLPG